MEVGDHNIEALRAAGAKRREAQLTS